MDTVKVFQKCRQRSYTKGTETHYVVGFHVAKFPRKVLNSIDRALRIPKFKEAKVGRWMCVSVSGEVSGPVRKVDAVFIQHSSPETFRRD